MKSLQLLLVMLLGTILFSSCQKESIDDNISSDLMAQINLSARDQLPNAAFDNTKKGVYHGVVAHQTTQSRGKIWINLGNNTKYTATLEMVGGKTLVFTASPKFAATTTINFNGKAGSFNVVMNDVNSPEVTNILLNNESYFGYVIKSTSTNRATSYTGTFNETGNTAFAGTWNILSNGVNNPNGEQGTAISDVMVTFNSAMFVDTIMETTTSICAAAVVGPWVPIVDVFATPNDGVAAVGQVSNFNGVSNWELIYSNEQLLGFPGYINNDTCLLNTSGTFSWTSAANGAVRNGEIYIDIAP